MSLRELSILFFNFDAKVCLQNISSGPTKTIAYLFDVFELHPFLPYLFHPLVNIIKRDIRVK